MKRTGKLVSKPMDVITISIKAQQMESKMNKQIYKTRSLACPTCLT